MSSINNLSFLKLKKVKDNVEKRIANMPIHFREEIKMHVSFPAVLNMLFDTDRISQEECSEFLNMTEDLMDEEMAVFFLKRMILIRSSDEEFMTLKISERLMMYHFLALYAYAYGDYRFTKSEAEIFIMFNRYGMDLLEEYVQMLRVAQGIHAFFYSDFEKHEEESKKITPELALERRQVANTILEVAERNGSTSALICAIDPMMRVGEIVNEIDREDYEASQAEIVIREEFVCRENRKSLFNMRTVSKYWLNQWQLYSNRKYNEEKRNARYYCWFHNVKECELCDFRNSSYDMGLKYWEINALSNVVGIGFRHDLHRVGIGFEVIIALVDKIVKGLVRHVRPFVFEGKNYSMCRCSQDRRYQTGRHSLYSHIYNKKRSAKKYNRFQGRYAILNMSNFFRDTSASKCFQVCNEEMRDVGKMILEGEYCSCKNVFRQYLFPFALIDVISRTRKKYEFIQNKKNYGIPNEKQIIKGENMLTLYYDTRYKEYFLYNLCYKHENDSYVILNKI